MSREPFLMWPVLNVWHSINHPFSEPRSWGPHEGVDIYGKLGDGVVASEDGKVVWASDQRRTGGDSAYGNHIIIEHEGGWITWYCHLNDMVVAIGDFVVRGEVIGYVGNTGRSTGPHLHYNLQYLGHGRKGYIVPDVVDPEIFLQQ